jgi:hypothetical protein
MFLKELRDNFPYLKNAVNAQHGLLHLEMHVFRDFLQHAITYGEVEKVRLCFAMAERYFAHGNAALQNAIAVSFVEHLNLQTAQWAWDMLGPSLKQSNLHFVDVGLAKPLPYQAGARRGK